MVCCKINITTSDNKSKDFVLLMEKMKEIFEKILIVLNLNNFIIFYKIGNNIKMNSLDKNKIEIKSFVYDWGLIFLVMLLVFIISVPNYLE